MSFPFLSDTADNITFMQSNLFIYIYNKQVCMEKNYTCLTLHQIKFVRLVLKPQGLSKIPHKNFLRL